MIGPSDHSVHSLQIFYPEADGFAVIREVEQGVPVEPEVAVRLVGRGRAIPGSRYVLHRERTGLFVLREPDEVVVTFLRFYALAQHELASALWPGGDPPTCQALWLGQREAKAQAAARRRPGQRFAISAGACKATKLDRPTLQALVLEAIAQDSLEPCSDYYSPNIEATGILRLEAAALAVAVTPQLVQVQPAQLRPEVSRARRKETLRAQRVDLAARNAAKFLRALGWTCTPPDGEGA